MRKYYTRPCNFFYGNYAKKLIKGKKAKSLTGREDIAFDKIEIFEKTKHNTTKSRIFDICDIKRFPPDLLKIVTQDLQNITQKRPDALRLKFNKPKIMGVLNITPDSFSDGGNFFETNKAYEQAKKHACCSDAGLRYAPLQ